MNTNNEAEEADGKEFMLDGQKLIADTISVPLSKEELRLLIDKLCDVSLTVKQSKQAFNTYQKLNKKLETLENNNAD